MSYRAARAFCSAFVAALLAVLFAASATAVAAPADPVGRVADRARAVGLSEAESAALLEIVKAAAAKSLPAGIVADKAVEGLAKGVPATRIASALAELSSRLERADAAIAAALPGVATEARTETVRAGADALRAGASPDQVGRVARASSSATRGAAALDALAGLVHAGVPVETALSVVSRALAKGFDESQLIRLDRATEEITRTGVPTASAADAALDGISRGLSPSQIADQYRGVSDGLTGGFVPGGLPGEAGSVPGGRALEVPGGELDFSNVPTAPTGAPTGAPTATPGATTPPIP